MINGAIGVVRIVDGAEAVETRLGAQGHAVYGPYVTLDAGSYVAEFRMKLLDPAEGSRFCAIVEAVAEEGRTVFARAPVFSSQTDAPGRYELAFAIDRPVHALELRIWVNGNVRLLVFDSGPIRKATAIAAAPPRSALLKESAEYIDDLYVNGFGIRALDDELIVEHSGVSLHARVFDDIRFLKEIFISRVYDLLPFAPSMLFDVGMNIGATSLLLAQNASFEEIHAFEPFPTTYRRAVANLALNPKASAKITAHNFGLSDHEETLEGFFNPADSGMSSTVTPGHGELSQSVAIKDAAQVLAPLFQRAEANRRRIVMKIDCEGSEFALFRSLDRAGLLRKVTAMAVEWHHGFGDRDKELFAPLARNGFVVIDRDPPTGNGFFYAVRAA
jgi:FkbM family methyltransferase